MTTQYNDFDLWMKRQWCERCKCVVETVWIIKRQGINSGTYTACSKCRLLLERAGLLVAVVGKYYDYVDTKPAAEWVEWEVTR